jgi:acyl carrier protein
MRQQKEKVMSEHERIVQAVYNAVDELNQQLPKGVHIEKSLDAELYGKSGKLESIDVVSFIMEVEDQIKAEFGVSIIIADDRAMSQQHSPFLTLGTLTEYLAQLLKENGASTV